MIVFRWFSQTSGLNDKSVWCLWYWTSNYKNCFGCFCTFYKLLSNMVNLHNFLFPTTLHHVQHLGWKKVTYVILETKIASKSMKKKILTIESSTCAFKVGIFSIVLILHNERFMLFLKFAEINFKALKIQVPWNGVLSYFDLHNRFNLIVLYPAHKITLICNRAILRRKLIYD